MKRPIDFTKFFGLNFFKFSGPQWMELVVKNISTKVEVVLGCLKSSCWMNETSFPRYNFRSLTKYELKKRFGFYFHVKIRIESDVNVHVLKELLHNYLYNTQ